MYLFRLRNANDLFSVVDELSALLDKKVLLEVYMKATEAPYSFLFIKLTSKTINDMFFVKFDKMIMINNEKLIKKYAFKINRPLFFADVR